MNKQSKQAAPGRVGEDEWRLICLAAGGDGAAYEKLVTPYMQRIYNIGLKMLADREEAADMTQDTLIKAYRNLPRFRGDSAFYSWLYQIAVNTCRDMMRSAYRAHETSFSEQERDGEEDKIINVVDTSTMPEHIYNEKECREYLHSLIRRLTPRYRLTVALREIADLSYADIARITGVSVGTVKSRLSRARAVMQQQAAADAEHYPELLRLMNKGGANNAM